MLNALQSQQPIFLFSSTNTLHTASSQQKPFQFRKANVSLHYHVELVICYSTSSKILHTSTHLLNLWAASLLVWTECQQELNQAFSLQKELEISFLNRKTI